jgi:lysophospholipid acyltransferase (LPLAT)-like uncharacterized protein
MEFHSVEHQDVPGVRVASRDLPFPAATAFPTFPPGNAIARSRSVRIRSRLLTKLLAATAVLLCRLLFLTCRKQWRVAVAGTNPYAETGDKRFLYCIWHDQIVMTVFFNRPCRVAGLVSRHQDGSYLADAMRLVGVTPVRGSSSRGGAQAMRQMFDAARELHISITPDGPRGPRRRVKEGIVYLASRSGRPIVPVALACQRAWRIRGSWTDMLIPRPFTTAFAIAGEPIHVPAGQSREQLVEYTARVQAAMDGLQIVVERWAAGAEPPNLVAPSAAPAATSASEARAA